MCTPRLAVVTTQGPRRRRELIGQALANLIDNALKYGAVSAGAEARVTLDAWREAGTVRLAVSDHGPGIPETDRARVLGRFVRLEDARSRPGFGLGLSLVNAVVRLHHGTLRLADNGPGLRVEIEFPASAQAQPAAGDILPAPPSGDPVPDSLSRAT